MNKFLKKLTQKVGQSAGTLHYTGDAKDIKANITIYDYDSETLQEKKDANIDQCIDFLKTKRKTWIHVCGISDPKKIEALGKNFGFHSLLLEDIMNPMQRSKLEDYKTFIFIVARILNFDQESSLVIDEQFSLILGPNYVISFLDQDRKIFDPLKERLRKAKSALRQKGVDYLAYSMLDSIVDNYFLILEKVDDQLETLEDKILNSPNSSILTQIQHSKRVMATLRRSIWPMREVVNHLRKIDSSLISANTKLYLYDVYDHTVQAIETAESFRDIVAGMLEVYISNINQRMNEIMKFLTIVATIFVPLTFIASLYGMNFKEMPGLNSPYGFPIIVGIMLFTTLYMLFYFYRKKWIFVPK